MAKHMVSLTRFNPINKRKDATQKEKIIAEKATKNFKKTLKDQVEMIINALKLDYKYDEASVQKITEDRRSEAKKFAKKQLASNLTKYFQDLKAPLKVEHDPLNENYPFKIIPIGRLGEKIVEKNTINDSHKIELTPELKNNLDSLEKKLIKNSKKLGEIIDSCVDKLADDIEQRKQIHPKKTEDLQIINGAVGAFFTSIALATMLAVGVALAIVVPGPGVIIGSTLAIGGSLAVMAVGTLAIWAINEFVISDKGGVLRDGIKELESMCKTMEEAGRLAQQTQKEVAR